MSVSLISIIWSNVCRLFLFVCVVVFLWPSRPNGVMLIAISLPNQLGRLSPLSVTSVVHILSPETDNCPSWISWRKRITAENISWSNLYKKMLPTRQGQTSWLPVGCTSNWAIEACRFVLINLKKHNQIMLIKLTIKVRWHRHIGQSLHWVDLSPSNYSIYIVLQNNILFSIV